MVPYLLFLSFHWGEVHFHFIFITKSNSCGFGTCVEQIKCKKKKVMFYVELFIYLFARVVPHALI